MTRQEFIKWAEDRGYEELRKGHGRFVKIKKGIRVCFKVSKIAVRYEREVVFESGEKQWVRARSNYLKYLSIGEDGLLHGMKR